MQIGDLVQLYGSPWLGIGVITALHTQSTATVFFPNASVKHYPYDKTAEVWRERLEVICK